MKKIENYRNLYSISKTLRFSLIPQGKTLENFENKKLLEEDSVRAQRYEKVKSYIDLYHKSFIERVLNNRCTLPNLEEYARLYNKNDKTDQDKEKMVKLEESMKKYISDRFKKDNEYKLIFGKELIRDKLCPFLEDAANKEAVGDVKEATEAVLDFYDFTTYFTGFYENRENMYVSDKDNVSIAYRCINDKLPKFLDNIRVFEKAEKALSPQILEKIDMELGSYSQGSVKYAFNTEYFEFVLSQGGIDKYNTIIGGYANDDKTKIKGINEYINKYNQDIAKTDKSKKLPLLKPLYKQILSDKETASFIPQKFESDSELTDAINDFCRIQFSDTLPKIEKLFNDFENLDLNGIYITAGAPLTELSNKVFGSWDTVRNGWLKEYERENPAKNGKKTEKYYEKQDKAYKGMASFSLARAEKLGNLALEENHEQKSVAEYYKNESAVRISDIKQRYEESKNLIENGYSDQKKFNANEEAKTSVKNLLDRFKALEALLKPLRGTGKEEDKNDIFYGSFEPLYEEISQIDRLYDKVRNYATQKPYSDKKIKLNFENPKFLGGWDKNKEKDYRSVLLTKDGLYYLGVMDKSNSKIFETIPDADGKDCYSKMDYKLLPGPNKMLPKVFFAESNREKFDPSIEILKIRESESFKKGNNFSLEDCHKLIDFFKKSIEKHEDWSKFGFEFSPTESYKDIGEFYKEISAQGYKVSFSPVPTEYIDSLVNSGRLYLFQIYNKDFSPYSKGKENLHTMYFKMMFDSENLKKPVYKLSGGAEMFYRPASIKENERIIHHANHPVDNKNKNNPKKQSLFTYDLIKDKRYTKPQFSLHLPIALNFNALGQNVINIDVRQSLKNRENNYIIGIDRGERHLLYISVIDSFGNIVEQKSLNTIAGYKDGKVDYHALLEGKEKERDSARKNWTAISNIKELKEGYLSQAVNEICKLIIKYDAIVAMEDLNSGFKNSRVKVERQVYQKFENALITKLNYLVDKSADANRPGGLLNAYQLTNKADGINKARQNGFIFYIPAWLTSKIDPVTGFVDLLHPKYNSVDASKLFIERMDDIRYNREENLFEFDIDYAKYERTAASYIKKWTVCSNGERIENFRNPEKNSQWDNKTLVLTAEFSDLFKKYGIDYTQNLKAQILQREEKDFFASFMHLIKLCLQMRNSESGNTDVDYLISPVRDKNGHFFDSRKTAEYGGKLPENADANGAYNIARKALWAINVLKETDDDNLKKANLSISNARWLEFVQK